MKKLLALLLSMMMVLSFGTFALADAGSEPDWTAYNDLIAIGFMQTVQSWGVAVPGDVSVVGFDAIALSEYSYPPLTTVRHDFQRIGQELVKLVLAQIRSRGVSSARHDRVVVPTELIVRATTAPPPAR